MEPRTLGRCIFWSEIFFRRSALPFNSVEEGCNDNSLDLTTTRGCHYSVAFYKYVQPQGRDLETARMMHRPFIDFAGIPISSEDLSSTEVKRSRGLSMVMYEISWSIMYRPYWSLFDFLLIYF